MSRTIERTKENIAMWERNIAKIDLVIQGYMEDKYRSEKNLRQEQAKLAQLINAGL